MNGYYSRDQNGFRPKSLKRKFLASGVPNCALLVPFWAVILPIAPPITPQKIIFRFTLNLKNCPGNWEKV